MPIPVNKRYEIVFLSLHKLGPRLGNTHIAKRMNALLKWLGIGWIDIVEIKF